MSLSAKVTTLSPCHCTEDDQSLAPCPRARPNGANDAPFPHHFIDKYFLLQQASGESSWSSDAASKWSEKTPRRSVASCNNWVLILIPLLFLSVVAFYFIIVGTFPNASYFPISAIFFADFGVFSALVEEPNNKTFTTMTYNLSKNEEEVQPNTTIAVPVSTTTQPTTPIVVETTATTRIRATVTHVYRTPSTTTTTEMTTTHKPELKIKLKSNSTLIVLKKGTNGTEFMIEGLKFQHPREMLEVVSPPDLRKKPMFFDEPPHKPLTTPRGFQYSPTVPLVARLQAERADVTTTAYNDTNGWSLLFLRQSLIILFRCELLLTSYTVLRGCLAVRHGATALFAGCAVRSRFGRDAAIFSAYSAVRLQRQGEGIYLCGFGAGMSTGGEKTAFAV